MSHPDWLVKEIGRLFNEKGLAYSAIGKKLNLTIGQVANICRKNGWKRARPQPKVVVDQCKASPEINKRSRSKVSAQAAKGIQVKAKQRRELGLGAVVNKMKALKNGKEKPQAVEKLPETGLPLIELDQNGWRGCRWAVGETPRGDHLFCGEPVVGVIASYCECHFDMSIERRRSAPNPGFWRWK